MTGGELARTLFSEQGYVSIGSVSAMQVGETDGVSVASRKQREAVLRVLGPSSAKEYERQCERARALAPEIAAGPPFSTWPYYYRVEAAD